LSSWAKAISRPLDHVLFLYVNGSVSSPQWQTYCAFFATQQLPLLMAGGLAGALLVGDRQVKSGAVQVLLAMATAWLLASLGQHFLSIDRPFSIGLGKQWLPHAASNGFPSKHASVAFAFAAATAFATRRIRWAVPTFLAAGLIAWSRVYLGLHFPSDVGAGAVMGIFCGCLIAGCASGSTLAISADSAIRRFT